jgi:hypothetical protein
MKLGQPFLRIAPEALQAVDIDLAGGKALPMIYPQMPVSAEHQGIVASELICVDNGTPADCFNRHVQQALGRDIPDHLDLHDPVSLENSEDGDLSSRAATAVALASAPEIRLIQFNLTVHQQLLIQLDQNRPAQDRDGLQNRRVAQSDLLSNLAGRELHLKELDDPQPALIRNSQPIDPSARKVMKRIPAAFAAVPFAQDPIDYPASTPCTENTAIFCTGFFKEQSGSIFRSPDELKGLELHRHHYKLVSDLLQSPKIKLAGMDYLFCIPT